MGFNIYRKVEGQPQFYLIAGLGAGAMSYTDNSIVIGPKWQGPEVWYHVTSHDIFLESDPTPDKSIWSLPFRMGPPAEDVPVVFKLHKNYPNPFNPTTAIKYALPEGSSVELKIYDLMGREVRTLVNTSMGGGYRSTVWDGSDNGGKRVGSGMYIYYFSAKSLETNQEFSAGGKMVLLR